MPTSGSDPQFSDEELALILNRAAELQDGSPRSGAGRYTLAEIQEIAAGAGIAPSHVATAAATVRERAPESSRVLGAPWRFRFEETLEGEVADDVVGELIDLVRRASGMQGRVREALGSVEWSARDSFGGTHVTVTRRGGRTTLVVLSTRSDSAALTGIVGGFGAFAGSIALGVLIAGTGGIAAPLAGALGIAGATSGSWLSMRALWRRYARSKREEIADLSASLADAARRAIEQGRVVTEKEERS